MTQYDLINFDPFRNFSIGFDRMFDSLNEVSKINTSNFPPYLLLVHKLTKDGGSTVSIEPLNSSILLFVKLIKASKNTMK